LKILSLIFLLSLFILSVQPTSFVKDAYSTLNADSTVSDSVITFEKSENSVYDRNDFKILMEEFCTDKPISVQELKENRAFSK